MLRRLYVHNFRCLANFELQTFEQPSWLLLGPNGAGKSTVGVALEILQRIARGVNRIDDLITIEDMQRRDTPVRFEIEVDLDAHRFVYSLALELPERFRELRVLEERLSIDGVDTFRRAHAEVQLFPLSRETVSFGIDWHLVALPIVRQSGDYSPIQPLKSWLERLLVLRPTPGAIHGNSHQDVNYPDAEVINLGAWFTGLMLSKPSAYALVDAQLKLTMPDLIEVDNREIGKEARTLEIHFGKNGQSLTIPFARLSDGEKCFMIFALVIAANKVFGPLLCFWDEPDNFIAPAEVGQTILSLRKAFEAGGQFLATSHNPETIRKFSDGNTYYLYRNSHLEPTQSRRLDALRQSIDLKGDFFNALIRGDLP